MYRRAAPRSDHYFDWHVANANELLRERFDLRAVSDFAFLAACIGHSDIPIRLANPSIGRLLEVGLDPYHGLKCASAYKAVLQVAPLKPPLPSSAERLRQVEPSRVRITQQAFWR